MRVECPECGTAGKLKRAPSKPIRCPRCENTWLPGADDPADESGSSSAVERASARKRRAKETRRRRESGEDDRAVVATATRSRKVARKAGRKRKGGAARGGSGERATRESRKSAGRKRRSGSGERSRSGARGSRRRGSADDDHDDRKPPRRRRKNTTGIIVTVAILVLALGGGITFLVMLNRSGSGTDKAALRARAEAYTDATLEADADALMGFVTPRVTDRLREESGEAGIAMMKASLGMGAAIIQSAKASGAQLSMRIDGVSVRGKRGTVTMVTEVSMDGRTQTTSRELFWEVVGGRWYMNPDALTPPAGAQPAAGDTPTAEADEAGEAGDQPEAPVDAEDGAPLRRHRMRLDHPDLQPGGGAEPETDETTTEEG